MKSNLFHRLAAAGLVLACVAAGGWRPDKEQDLRDVLEEALDQPVKQIAITEKPLREALDQLELDTGVRFRLDERVYDLMPYGARTKVSLALADTSLRAGLRQMFDRLGLRMRVVTDKGQALLLVEPAPVLERLGRRVSVNELSVIERLASGPWKESTVAVQYRIDPARRPADALDDAIRQAGNGSGLSQLEAAAAALEWVWLPQDQQVVVMPRVEWVRGRLDEPLELSYQKMPLDEVLVALGQKAAVTVQFEPGCLERVGARQRLVDLVQKRMTVRQALELLCGRTGLRYEAAADGVLISSAAGQPPASSSSGRLGAIKFTVPLGFGGVSMDFLIPEEKLPPELIKLRNEKTEEILRELRAQQARQP